MLQEIHTNAATFILNFFPLVVLVPNFSSFSSVKVCLKPMCTACYSRGVHIVQTLCLVLNILLMSFY